MLAKQIQAGCPADVTTYASHVKWCGNAKALPQGRRVHAHVIIDGFESNGYLGRLLLQMYEKCGALDDALALFDRIDHQHASCATSIIQGYTRHERGNNALEVFDQMQQEGILPSRITYVCIFSAFLDQKALDKAKQMHARVMATSYSADIPLGTAIVKMYGRLGNLEDARTMFDKMPEHTVISWTTIISAYTQENKEQEALQLFGRMQQTGIQLDNITCVCVLAACSGQAALPDGQLIHTLMVESGLKLDVILETALISMYCKCGNIDDAWSMFMHMPSRNVISWTAMIGGFAQAGKAKEAVELLDLMCKEGVMPNKVTYISILTACTNQGALKEGKQVHISIKNRGLESDVYVGTSLFNMYGKCGSLQAACNVFNKISQRNTISWNAMISLHTEHGHGKEALACFTRMQQEDVTPDKVTFIHLLDVCTKLAFIDEGQHVYHILLHHELEQDVMIRTALINMYSECGFLRDVHTIFNQSTNRDIILWNAMIEVCVDHGQGRTGLQLFDQMLHKGVMPDDVTYVSVLTACSITSALTQGKLVHACILDAGLDTYLNVTSALVNMYGKCSSLEEAQKIFEQLPELNLILWTTMISLYAQHDDNKTAFCVFQQMHITGFVADKVTFASILSACSDEARLADGKRLHALIVGSNLESDNVIGSSLISMYGKCGRIGIAEKLFDKMPNNNLDISNAMIGVYAQHGWGKQALVLFQQMPKQGVFPDKLTCTSVLVACSRAGLLDEACRCFTLMKHNHGVTLIADHYSCVIDLLGRAGQLDEAEKLIFGMPSEPNISSYTALLGACRYQLDLECAERAAKHAFELDPENISTYVMLSNMYVAVGRNDDAAQLLGIARGKGLQMPESASNFLPDYKQSM